MSSIRNRPCWEIIQCKDAEECPARESPDIPCWIIAEKLNTSQSVMNVCDDCLVYIIKTQDPALTGNEVDNIMAYRDNHQDKKCPVYQSRKKQNRPRE